ncbi:Glycosyltransferase involved in cell wall bisynthesis [Streptococcus henryi]|uniref:Glycosyltransferase involved in cell wall bisynthesis n=1 Tax=Streptococcus henryi TaxID=439219 RepID=A0A1G6DA31_9STRE|nr:glycosyltransferase family 2 protein [Streptococcus henryi]SDB41971.1 Glycosyltransferase involved in cell wall bisynthesis [Streptococcus henryi]
MLVSIIIPIYNVEKYLEQCLVSIQKQSYDDFEAILIDDGSTDNSLAICEKICSIDSRFKVFNKVNGGQGIARNFGVAKASGDYVTFVDSDDYLEQDYIESLIFPLSQNKAIDLVIGGYKKVDDTGEIFYNESYQVGGIPNSRLSLKMLGALPNAEDSVKGTVWNALYKLDIINKNGIEFKSERDFFSEDTLFNLDYLKFSKLSFLIGNSSYCYRLNLDSTSTKFDRNKLQLINNYYYYIVNRFKNNNEAKLRVSKIYLHNLKRVIFQEKINPDNTNLSGLIKNISIILNNSTVGKVLGEYPIFRLNDKKSIFIFICCKFKFAHILSYLIWNGIGRSKRYTERGNK